MSDDMWHRVQSVAGWQYCTVFWLALSSEMHEIGDPPDGPHWILNLPAGEDGFDVITPSWSDGSIVLCRVHWRRPVIGMRRPHPRYVMSVDRRPWFVGSAVPERLLLELAAPQLSRDEKPHEASDQCEESECV